MNDGRAGIGQGSSGGSPGGSLGGSPGGSPGTPSILQPNRGIPNAQIAPALRPPTMGIAVPPIRPAPVRDEPLELVGEDRPTAEAPKSKIHGISSVNSLAAHNYKRPTNLDHCGAVRMRTFHCRLSEQGVEYLDQTINDWLEGHPDIEVKFTTSTVGLWDGKLKEPTLILNVWY